MSYEGPGLYRHYKGGIYIALGVAEDEATRTKRDVIYFSCSDAHEAFRASRGVQFIRRPLNPEDGPDAWNEMVGDPLAPRFERLDEMTTATTR
jgi:hypothetical protein